MKVTSVVGIALLLTACGFTAAVAQEAPVDARSTVETDEEAARSDLRDLFARPEVREAARVGGIDLEEAEERLDSLEGEQLHRAAQQARALESRLDAPQGEIRLSAITLIILLLLVVIIILLA